METSYLQEYRCVADHGSFTAAARELHVTQSTLSKHVAALEREFDAELFVRDRNGVSLTPEGRVLYAQALQVENVLGRTRSLMRTAGREGRQTAEGLRGPAGDARSGAGLGACGGTLGKARAQGRAGGFAHDAAARDTVLRCKCRALAREYGLSSQEVGALVLYLEEQGFETVQAELGVSRDGAADILASVYRKLDVGSKQEALRLVHSVSE